MQVPISDKILRAADLHISVYLTRCGIRQSRAPCNVPATAVEGHVVVPVLVKLPYTKTINRYRVLSIFFTNKFLGFLFKTVFPSGLCRLGYGY